MIDEASPAPPVDHARRCAWGCLVLALLGLGVGLVTMPPLEEQFRDDMGSTAIGSLKAITTAQAMFAQQDKDRDGAPDFAASLAELGAPTCGSLIDSTLASGRKSGYLFDLCRAPDAPTQRWMATARAVESRDPKRSRSFGVNHEGVIFFTTDAPFELTDDCAIPARALRLGGAAPSGGTAPSVR